MRYPEFLKDGGTIGFPAPSFGCNMEPYRSAFNNAQKILQAKGYRTLCGPNAYAGDGIGISSSPESCGREFTQMDILPECDVMISCGGGELMCEILDYVDFDAVKKAPAKWFMGYSDNTNLSFLLATLCDTASVYGPCAASFGMEPWHPAIEDAFALLQGKKLVMEGYDRFETEGLKDEEHPLAPYNCTERREIMAFPGEGAPGEREIRSEAVKADDARTAGSEDAGAPGAQEIRSEAAKASDARSASPEEIRFGGRLIGGCLDCLVNLCGTKYDQVSAFTQKYKDDGFVWFLEACDLNVYGIRRAVWELQHAGWFEHVNGFLIGRPLSGREEMFGLDHVHAVTDLLGTYGVPILMDVDLGHLPPMMPVVVGSMAQVSYRPARDAFRLEMQLR